jgi:uncharacterized protein (DUF305 family)
MGDRRYVHLAIMTIISFFAMFILMYAMVDRFENVYPNVNQFYMAGLMAAPMVLIELAVMRGMYTDQRANIAFAAVALVAMAGFFIGIRQQVAVTDSQFLKSMIPHHAGAILMCEKAPLQDAGIKELCATIIQSQQAEIADMKSKLNALNQ